MPESKALEAEVKSAKASPKYTKKDIDDGKILAVLSYVGILALIPYFFEKENQYVKDHAKVGMNLFLIEVIVSVGLGIVATACAITIVLIWLSLIVLIAEWVLGIVSLVLSVMGIINACNGEVKDLPIISKWKIIK